MLSANFSARLGTRHSVASFCGCHSAYSANKEDANLLSRYDVVQLSLQSLRASSCRCGLQQRTAKTSVSWTGFEHILASARYPTATVQDNLRVLLGSVYRVATTPRWTRRTEYLRHSSMHVKYIMFQVIECSMQGESFDPPCSSSPHVSSTRRQATVRQFVAIRRIQ